MQIWDWITCTLLSLLSPLRNGGFQEIYQHFSYSHQPIFTARCYAQRGLCPSVRSSVCKSHVGILSKRLNIIPKLFTIRQLHRSRYATPNGMGHWGVKCTGYEKIAIFDQYLVLSRKRYKTEPKLLWKANRKLYQSFRMVPVSMTLSDL